MNDQLYLLALYIRSSLLAQNKVRYQKCHGLAVLVLEFTVSLCHIDSMVPTLPQFCTYDIVRSLSSCTMFLRRSGVIGGRHGHRGTCNPE